MYSRRIISCIIVIIGFFGNSVNTEAQTVNNGIVDLSLGVHLALPTDPDLSQKFSYGGGATFGISVFVPKFKTYFTPQLSLDFMNRKVGHDDTYKENILFWSAGLEGMYKLFSTNGYDLLPFVGLSYKHVKDNYLVANGDIIIHSNGGSNLDYDTKPSIFSGDDIALSLGFENRINERWFIRVSYEFYNPEVDVALGNSYDSIDQSIFEGPTQKINLSLFRLGFGVYFW